MSSTAARSIVACVLLGMLASHAQAAVFGFDDRRPYDEVAEAELSMLGDAVGAITCFDGSRGSGFVVDVGEYVGIEPDFYVIATTAHVLYDGETGASRGRCAFRPASAPGVHFELGERLVGATRLDNADEADWAFARIDKFSHRLEPMRVAFGETYDFGDFSGLELRAVGFDPELDGLVVASDCELDDKSSYPSLSRQKRGIRRMVIHDCDFVEVSRGGPLLVLSGGALHVIAVNAGDSGGQRFTRLSGIPYDPKRNFYNFSRRFDRELEEKLIAFVSRFAHLRNPSPTTRARSDLIESVQFELNRLGYDAGPVDGLAGRKTREAVEAFQTALGITPTGWISEELLLLLKAK